MTEDTISIPRDLAERLVENARRFRQLDDEGVELTEEAYDDAVRGLDDLMDDLTQLVDLLD